MSKQNKKLEYVTVSIPRSLYLDVKEILKEDKTYSSPTEFIKDAIRRRIDEVTA